METNPPKRQVPKPTQSVIRWLLDSDPAIRWQVLRDLADAPAEVVAAERARVATEGGAPGCWPCRAKTASGREARYSRRGGLNQLDEQPAGQPWTATAYSLVLLHDFGVDPRGDTGAPGGGAGQRPLPLGARRPAVLQRRGRAVHQRHDRRAGRLLRSRCRWRGRPATR